MAINGRQTTYPPGVKVPKFDAHKAPSTDYSACVDAESTLVYFGRFDTGCKTANKYHDDPNFKSWAELKGIKLPSEYGLAQLNATAVYKEVNKYGGPDVDGGRIKVYLMMAVQDVIHMVRPYIRVDRTTPIAEVLDSIDTSRSPGFPWNKNYTTFSDAYAAHADYVQSFIDAVGRGDQPLTFWNYFPKEEILPEEKISAGRVRQISGCAMEMRMLGNHLFLGQNERMTANFEHMWSKVGISPMRRGWDALYNYLSQVSTTGFALDISRFDANFQYWLAQSVARVRLACMSEEMKTPEVVRQVHFFYENTFRGLGVLPHGEVVSKSHGNNSGSPNTTYDNTLGNMIAFLTVWYMSCADEGVQLDPMDHLRVAIYGDDNTSTVSEAGRRVLTVPRIIGGFREFGWGVTFEVGNGYVPLHTMAFLSFFFKSIKYNGQSFRVPLPRDGKKALASLAYKGKRDPVVSYARACGLLIVYWWDFEVRRILDGYLNHLEDVYLNTPQCASIRKQRLTSGMIDALYLSVAA